LLFFKLFEYLDQRPHFNGFGLTFTLEGTILKLKSFQDATDDSD